jgi:hypothetical protein
VKKKKVLDTQEAVDGKELMISFYLMKKMMVVFFFNFQEMIFNDQKRSVEQL